MIIASFAAQMLPYMLISLPLFIVWRIFRSRKTTARHEIGTVVFAMFLVGLASQTVFPDSSGISFDSFNINLTPFNVFTVSYRDYVYNGSTDYFAISLLGNIFMFVPIGLCVPLLTRTRFLKTTLIGFLCSLSIELIQLPLSRWSDVDDLWLNTLGTVLGYALYRLLAWLFPVFIGKFRS